MTPSELDKELNRALAEIVRYARACAEADLVPRLDEIDALEAGLPLPVSVSLDAGARVYVSTADRYRRWALEAKGFTFETE